MHEDTPAARGGLTPAELAVLRSLNVMWDRGDRWLTPTEIAAAAAVGLRSVNAALSQLRRRELARAHAGRWSLNTTGIPNLTASDLRFIGGQAARS